MIVLTGATGQLGTAFRHRLGEAATYLTRDDLDLADPAAIPPRITSLAPTLVINCAAHTAVDAAEADEAAARAVNADAVEALAAATADLGAGFVTFSSDYVFDGTKDAPYVEDDEPNPINAYGRAKLDGERRALVANPRTLVVRTSWLLSGTHPNFAATMLRRLAAGPVDVVDDQYGHPTLVDDLAAATLAAVDKEATGILHLTNQGVTTWFDLAVEIAATAGLDEIRVRPISTADLARPAPRPQNSVLDSVRLGELGLAALPDYHDGLPALVAQLRSGNGP